MHSKTLVNDHAKNPSTIKKGKKACKLQQGLEINR